MQSASMNVLNRRDMLASIYPARLTPRGLRCVAAAAAAARGTPGSADRCLQLLSPALQHHLAHPAAIYHNKPACLTLGDTLDQIYEQLDDEVFASRGGYSIPKKERAVIDATGGSATYGEALAPGLSQLLAVLQMGPGDVFYDLGSGTGRAVLQVASNGTVAKAVGVELSATRHKQAEAAAAALAAAGVPLAAPVEFHHADLAAADLSGGTHFLLCSTAFGAGICRRVAERLAALPSFRVLVTSRELPPQASLVKLGEFDCEYSWNAAGIGFVYVRSLAEAPTALLARFNCGDGVAWLPSEHAPAQPPLALTFAPEVLERCHDAFLKASRVLVTAEGREQQ